MRYSEREGLSEITTHNTVVPRTALEVHTARSQQDRQPLTLPPKFGQCPVHLLKEGIKTTCDLLYFNVNRIIKATPMPCPVPKTQKFGELPGALAVVCWVVGEQQFHSARFAWVYVCGLIQ